MGQPILSNSERLSKEMTNFAQELQKPYLQGQNASLRDWVKKTKSQGRRPQRHPWNTLLCLAVCSFPPSRETGWDDPWDESSYQGHLIKSLNQYGFQQSHKWDSSTSGLQVVNGIFFCFLFLLPSFSFYMHAFIDFIIYVHLKAGPREDCFAAVLQLWIY